MKKLTIDINDTPLNNIYINISKYSNLSDLEFLNIKKNIDFFIEELEMAKSISQLDIYISNLQKNGINTYEKIFFEKKGLNTYLKFQNYFYKENSDTITFANIAQDLDIFVAFIKNKSTNNIFKIQNHYYKEIDKNKFSISIFDKSLYIDFIDNKECQLIKIENNFEDTKKNILSNQLENKDVNSFIESVRIEKHNNKDIYFIKLKNLFISEMILSDKSIIGTSISPETYALIRKYSKTDDLIRITQQYKLNTPIVNNYNSLFEELNYFWELDSLVEDNHLCSKNINLADLIKIINDFVDNNHFYTLSNKHYNILSNIFKEITSKKTIIEAKSPIPSKFKEMESYDINNINYQSFDYNNIIELWKDLNFDLKVLENKTTINKIK